MVVEDPECKRTDSDLSNSLSCAFDSDTDTLTITGAFSSSLNSGVSTGFYVNTVTNPISGSAVILTLTTYTSDGYAIDSGAVSFSATTPAILDPD